MRSRLGDEGRDDADAARLSNSLHWPCKECNALRSRLGDEGRDAAHAVGEDDGADQRHAQGEEPLRIGHGHDVAVAHGRHAAGCRGATRRAMRCNGGSETKEGCSGRRIALRRNGFAADGTALQNDIARYISGPKSVHLICMQTR